MVGMPRDGGYRFDVGEVHSYRGADLLSNKLMVYLERSLLWLLCVRICANCFTSFKKRINWLPGTGTDGIGICVAGRNRKRNMREKVELWKHCIRVDQENVWGASKRVDPIWFGYSRPISDKQTNFFCPLCRTPLKSFASMHIQRYNFNSFVLPTATLLSKIRCRMKYLKTVPRSPYRTR